MSTESSKATPASATTIKAHELRQVDRANKTGGQKGNTVPSAITNASFKLQERNRGVTEIIEMPNRGHALTIDNGWREVADTALTFVRRFVSVSDAHGKRIEMPQFSAR